MSKVLRKPRSFYETYERKTAGGKQSTHYCPGCGHGNMHKLIAEALDDLGLQDRSILVSPVGCSVFAYYYFDVGNVQVAHGRAPAVATGLKRSRPESIVMCYQGDGDLAAIGGNNILQAANRGESITVFFINNAIYGMTGGQMAPTTLIGQKTTTTPYGRSSSNEGFPVRVCELLSTLEGPAYIERTALTDSKNIARTRRAVRKAIKCQAEGKGFALVEVLSPCPTGWKVPPSEGPRWVEEMMMDTFPPGLYKDVIDERESIELPEAVFDRDSVYEALGFSAEESAIPSKPSSKPSPGYENPEIKVAGFGGQGVLLLGLILAESGMLDGYHVTWLPSYGPEMRGGTANCHVIISEKRIGSPLVARPTVLVAMNRPSLERFEPDLLDGSLLLYDSSLIDTEPTRTDLEVLAVPATKFADELGNTRAANMVMLGAYIEKSGILSRDSIVEAMRSVVTRTELCAINEAAIDKGMEYVRVAASKAT
jgi:2-oxoisovalerate ferredoxin oxidoreductase beta subunit